MMQRVGDNIGIVSAIKEKTMGLTIDHLQSLKRYKNKTLALSRQSTKMNQQIMGRTTIYSLSLSLKFACIQSSPIFRLLDGCDYK